jgi:hypothetical protein
MNDGWDMAVLLQIIVILISMGTGWLLNSVYRLVRARKREQEMKEAWRSRSRVFFPRDTSKN